MPKFVPRTLRKDLIRVCDERLNRLEEEKEYWEDEEKKEYKSLPNSYMDPEGTKQVIR